MWCSSSSLCRSYTQLFISFTSSEFLTNIAILENTIDEVCSRMSTNLICLILLKLTSCSLVFLSNFTNSVIRLWMLLLMLLYLLFLRQEIYVFCLILIYHVLVTFRLLLNLVFLILGRRIRPILNQITARNITTALLHSKLDYYNYFSIFLQINWIVFSLFLILLLVQSLEPQISSHNSYS